MFKLAKHTGLPRKGMLQDFAPATALQTRSNIVSGTAVTIDSSGDLDIAATTNVIAGILAVTAGTAVNAAGGNEAYTGVNDHLPFIVIDEDTLIEADLDAAVALSSIVKGVTTFDLADGLTLDATLPATNDDFKVLKAGKNDGTDATTVIGYFTSVAKL